MVEKIDFEKLIFSLARSTEHSPSDETMLLFILILCNIINVSLWYQ